MSTDNEMSGKKLDTICDQQLGGYCIDECIGRVGIIEIWNHKNMAYEDS